MQQLRKADKLGRLDIKATINQTKIVNIEIQVKNNKNMEQRSEFYGAKLITEQMGKKDKYEELKPVILINILNYSILKVPEYCTKTVTVADKHREYEIIKDITYWFIELPKFRKSKPKIANALEGWLALIDDKDRGLIKMAEEKHEIIKEAKEEVEEILSDAVIKEINEFRQTAIWDENSVKHHAREKGLKEGRRQGVKEGREEGIKEGRKEGIKEGKKEESKRIIINMLKKEMKLDEIVDLTGVAKEEIEEVKRSIK